MGSLRALLLATVLPAALVLAGCSTAEGQRAQELLLAADAAQAQLTSSSFEGGLSFALSGREVGLRFEGAGSKERGYLSMRSDGLPGASFDLQVVVRGEQVWMELDGGWQKLPAAAGPDLGSASLGPAAFAELARHVKDVRVTEGQLVDGRPVSVVAGEIDTVGLLGAMSKLGGLGELEPSGLDLNELGAGIGDIEAVLTIDERTHLLDSALVTLSIDAAGEPVEVTLNYRLTSANQPVRVPPVPG
jgi:hypothetical protein